MQYQVPEHRDRADAAGPRHYRLWFKCYMLYYDINTDILCCQWHYSTIITIYISGVRVNREVTVRQKHPYKY